MAALPRHVAGAGVVLTTVVYLFACSSNDANPWQTGAAGPTVEAGAGTSCVACQSNAGCGGAVCAELGGSTYCAATCSTGACPSDQACTTVTTVSGSTVSACVPRSNVCGGSTSGGGGGSGSSGSASSGSGGSTGSSGGGASSGGASSTSSSGGGTSSSSGSQPVGTVGANGGTLTTLLFGVVGDTRPANEDDLTSYPTTIITKLFADVQAHTPAIPFVVSTGDYQFSSTGSSSTAADQLSLYVQARAQYSGMQFTAMGNHECTGADDSNCPAGSSPTANYKAWMAQLMAPIQKTLPYYVINVNATDASWTAKFVFIAANAWDSTQESWLTATMQVKTTYTFVLRHEPTESSGNAPGVAPSDSIIKQYPYTALITGHSHTWDYFGENTAKEVLVGNGGAPLTNSSKNYGYAIFAQRSDGAIVMDMYDYETNQAVSEFHKIVTPAGVITQ
ncbi:MAG TPA: metallophosphoesterase [Polyangiaceae bacterium]|jgi:hypothetical protein